jgi:hypothetical protein
MVEIIRERNLVLEEDLKRDFKPFEIFEGNFQYRVVGPDLCIRTINRRQRKVRYVSSDQNRICETITDLGVATDEDAFVMPCDGAVEMAQANELFDWAKRARNERKAREAWVKPIRDEAFRNYVADAFEEGARRAVGQSSFGPLVQLQREKPA